jgi:serine/threonine protein kinase
VFGDITTVVTEVAENRSLANYLLSTGGVEMCQLRGETRIATAIAGAVLATRYLDSLRVIHCDLNRDNSLLDLDWSVRIARFAHSRSRDQPVILNNNRNWPFIESHYLAPDCYDHKDGWESGIFSCGLILYELVVREVTFSKNLVQYAIAKRPVLGNEWTILPAFVLPPVL